MDLVKPEDVGGLLAHFGLVWGSRAFFFSALGGVVPGSCRELVCGLGASQDFGEPSGVRTGLGAVFAPLFAAVWE